MQVTNPRYIESQGVGALTFELEGKKVQIVEPKPTLFLHGIVYLGPDFEQTMPTIALDDTILEGCTTDPEVVYWQNRFIVDLHTGRFSPGALEKVDLDRSELEQVKAGVFEK